MLFSIETILHQLAQRIIGSIFLFFPFTNCTTMMSFVNHENHELFPRASDFARTIARVGATEISTSGDRTKPQRRNIEPGMRGALTRCYGTDGVGVQVGRAVTETAERAFGGKPSGGTRRGLLSEYSVMLCMAS